MTSTKILINATHHEEVRVAIIENNKLIEYDHDRLDNINKKGCIYKGVVSRIEPSLNAAFIDYGEARHGFLPAAEVSTSLYPAHLDKHGKYPIQDLLQKGQEIIIQVEKEEQGNKGAAITTNISLAGCYLVLMPVTPNSGGISRQIEGDDRDYLQRVLNQIDIPDDVSVIIRTASIGRNLEELLWDFNVLTSQWDAILQYAKDHAAPQLLYKDGALLSRVIRDYLKPSISEIWIDEESVYEEMLKLVQHVRPDFLSLVKLFKPTNGLPLFAHYQIEHDIESIFNPEVVLENGATLVIDHREALTSIDINSARSTTSSDIDTTAFKTNLAAAEEIARQIRLRNIGGQIIIDFIHMTSQEQCRQVETAIRNGLNGDKARIQVGKISKLGLLEISRQRLKTALDKSQLMTCQHCHGRGTHRQPQAVSLSILRLIEQESVRYRNGHIVVKIHPSIALYFFNHYRQSLCELEKKTHIQVHIQTDSHKSPGDYDIIFHAHGDEKVAGKTVRNYIPPIATQSPSLTPASPSNEQHASKVATPPYASHVPAIPTAPRGSFLSKMWHFLFGAAPAAKSSKNTSSHAQEPTSRSHKHHSEKGTEQQATQHQRGHHSKQQHKHHPKNDSQQTVRNHPKPHRDKDRQPHGQKTHSQQKPVVREQPRTTSNPSQAHEAVTQEVSSPKVPTANPVTTEKKKPAKKPHMPTSQSQALDETPVIIQAPVNIPTLSEVPSASVSQEVMKETVIAKKELSTETSDTTAGTEPPSTAEVVKKNHHRRRSHRRGPRKSSNNPGTSSHHDAPSSQPVQPGSGD